MYTTVERTIAGLSFSFLLGLQNTDQGKGLIVYVKSQTPAQLVDHIRSVHVDALTRLLVALAMQRAQSLQKDYRLQSLITICYTREEVSIKALFAYC